MSLRHKIISIVTVIPFVVISSYFIYYARHEIYLQPWENPIYHLYFLQIKAFGLFLIVYFTGKKTWEGLTFGEQVILNISTSILFVIAFGVLELFFLINSI